MKVLHALWLPDPGDRFVQSGAFRLWVETDRRRRSRRRQKTPAHPFALPADDWPGFLDALGMKPAMGRRHPALERCLLQLPSAADTPLPSPQLARAWPEPLDLEGVVWKLWQVDAYPVADAIRRLSEIHFLAFYHTEDVQAGSDLLFWYWFTQELKRLLMRDQYLPALVYRQPPTAKGRRKTPPPELYGTWQWASESHERLITQAAERMPAACATGADGPLEAEGALRHCAEVLLNEAVRQVRWPAVVTHKTDGTLLSACLHPNPEASLWETPADPRETYRHWQSWRERIGGTGQGTTFTLGFRVAEPLDEGEDDWALHFLVAAKDDPSYHLALADYWAMPASERKQVHKQFGKDFEQRLLLDLGVAARMVPALWDGLDTSQPQGVRLVLSQAFTFLQESAWVLEDAGFRVIVPAWWTPQGRRRMKIRLRSSRAKGSRTAAPGDSGLGLENLVRFHYQLAIGDEVVSEAEWRRLVEAKSPLVRFRGQWVMLDRDKMEEMLAFWQRHGQESPEVSVQELLRRTAEDEDFEVDREDALAEMLERLRDRSRLEPGADPPGLRAELREYQRRGVAWLAYLEQLGLNGCLADDMGLGKTMQVIARLLQERAAGEAIGPTLLIAPTSVLGNWEKEVQRFAPQLATVIHHGAIREQDADTFRQSAAKQDLVITSYTLARKDEKLLRGLRWHRVVLDEAQNIKNPKAAQSRAVCKLAAPHRLALTGTPVENRLMDLWSIFQFLNPGYLDTQAQFRKRFEIPVQRDHDPLRTTTIKRLVEPFVLRRLKTDKAIVKDLPDKVEALQYCNLSREQAALYEGVVRDVERQLEEKDGIERQGLMLSTLMKLKQICNHPAQFLQDGSPFSAERSHKLERLQEMLEELLAEGDSALIFTQFTEVGERLERLLRQERRYNTYYLHGGTSRMRREQMIAEFQDPKTEPSLFVLSLKAGGVGITLTKANHVFHFDRWWNPAVEDQASDRAFRIGQEKKVFVHKFVTLGTLEERIHDLIEEKKALSGAVVGSDESWLTQLDNERFRDLIRLNRAAVVD